MGIQMLQGLLETQYPGACVSVDLLRIASSIAGNYQGRGYLNLVIDGECCLDRLYGGYVSDWTCGGQWNRMLQFLAALVQTLRTNRINLAIFFNGALEKPRIQEWIRSQMAARSNIYQILRHINTKGTPPPKVWWVPPSCLHTSLRLALRHLKMVMVSSVEDHHYEIIAHCRQYDFHGLMGEDAEYAIFEPPRYFSSKQLKLTYKGSLETKEFILDEVAKGLNLNPSRFCLLAALLGCHLLPDNDLRSFHKKLLQTNCSEGDNAAQQLPPEAVLKAVAGFVRELESIEDIDKIALEVFGSATDTRVEKLKQAIQYYSQGTKEGFGQRRHTNHGKSSGENGNHKLGKLPNGDVREGAAAKLASELPDDELASAQDKLVLNGIASSDSSTGSLSPSNSNSKTKNAVNDGKYQPVPQVAAEVLRTALERHSRGFMSPLLYQILTQGEIRLSVCLEDQAHREVPNIQLFYRPVRQMVYAILFNLHHHTYLAEKEKEAGGTANVPDIKVREWVWTSANPYRHPDVVPALPVGWPVPTVQRLWFGTSLEDKKRRLRAFLSCLHSDSPLMLNTEFVPQHLLVLACVLRYIMSSSMGCLLQKHELDAFIVQAFSPELTSVNFLQDLQLPKLSARGVQLASLFMEGVETALLVNDACGSPIPWVMTSPWLFFDGKLFHAKLFRASNAKDVYDLCDHRPEMVFKVERLRKAVLEGLNPRVPPAFPPIPPYMAPVGQVMLRRGVSANRRGLMARGGHLEVGGVVVGSWGANYGRGRGPPSQFLYGVNSKGRGGSAAAGHRGRGAWRGKKGGNESKADKTVEKKQEPTNQTAEEETPASSPSTSENPQSGATAGKEN